MFWGLIMEPKRRYSQSVKRPFHISMAALDIFSADDNPTQLMLFFEERNYLLCTLQKGHTVQCPLDLNFEAGDEVVFATNGDCNIHLSGYLQEDEFDYDDDDEGEEAEEEELLEVVTRGARKRKTAVKNDKNEDVDDDEEMDEPKATTKKRKSNEKPGATLESLLKEDLDENDEDDESFMIQEEDSFEGEEEDDDEEEEDDESEQEYDSENEMKEIVKQSQKINEPKMNGVKPAKKQAKNEKAKIDQSPKQKNQQKKTLEGGVVIQDLKVGQGSVAKSGKLVQVYYEGRLKQNNKMFDQSKKGQGFKFRLGKQEVIKGWDIGVAGMKVGGTRRIICPPAMAYGQKGSPPAIPPNSSLVFEVELKNVL